MTRQNQKGLFPCDKCQFQGNSNSSLAYHLQKHQEKFVRKTCDYKSSHTEGRKFVCNVPGCSSTFQYPAGLNLHTRSHPGERPFKCNFNGCTKSFTVKGSLKNHVFYHTGARPFPCTFDNCNLRFKTKGTLQQHVTIHSGEKLFPCNLCNKLFRQKNSLFRHIRTHTGEKPYKCSHQSCSASFADESSLRRHLFIHAEKKPLTCNLCFKSFRFLYILNEHIRLHTGEKPFRCIVSNCLFESSSSSSLRQHIRRRHNKNQFVCNYGLCGYSFTSVGDLKRHSVKHAVRGTKRFKCDLEGCHYSSDWKCNLEDHKQRHNKKKQYECSLCSFEAKTCIDIQNHFIRKHKSKLVVTPAKDRARVKQVVVEETKIGFSDGSDPGGNKVQASNISGKLQQSLIVLPKADLEINYSEILLLNEDPKLRCSPFVLITDVMTQIVEM